MRQILLLFLLLSSVAVAHPGAGHDHQHATPPAISQGEAQEKARTVVAKKVEMGKLGKTWLAVDPSKSYKKSFGHGPEWVVEFHDPKAADKSKDTVYVFLALTGKVLGINFTGQ